MTLLPPGGYVVSVGLHQARHSQEGGKKNQ
jgi:hypothetical protein